jgi:PUA-domain protein
MAKITVRKRHAIRKSHVSDLFEELAGQIGDASGQFVSDRIEKADTDSEFDIYLIDKKPLLMGFEGWVFPTVRGLIQHPFENRRIIVDQGAIRFVVNGADIMRPGIVSISDDVRAGSPVQIVEERFQKPLAVCIALFDAADIRAMEKGKACRNIHYVGDDIWNLEL